MIAIVGLAAFGSLLYSPLPQDDSLEVTYKWFDTLDFDEVRTGQFVEFHWTNQEPFQHPEAYYYGFQSRGKDSVLSIDLGRAEPGDKVFGIEPVDFRKFVDEQIHLLQTQDPEHPNSLINGQEAEFVICRACVARGLAAEAQAIWKFASRSWQPSDLTAHLRDWIAESQVHGLDFGRIDLPWTYHLDKARRLARLFGDTRLGPEAKETVQILEAMVHPKPLPSNADDVDRLIEQLPDEKGIQVIQPGRPELFDDSTPSARNAVAWKLANIGYRAVPKLIDALADRRFTYTTGGFVRHNFRVGDLASMILAKISSHDFTHSMAPLEGTTIAAAQAEARAWWSVAGKSGELDNLKAGMKSRDSFATARALKEKYPNQASRLIGKAIDESASTPYRKNLIEELGYHPDDDAVAILKRDAEHGPDPVIRFEAADALRHTDLVFTAKMLARQWRTYLATGKAVETDQTKEVWLTDAIWLERFIEPLTYCGNAETIRCLNQGFASRSSSFRKEVIEKVFDQAHNVGSLPVATVVEELLLSELDNETVSSRNNELRAATVGEIAALALSRYLPAKYPAVKIQFRGDFDRQKIQYKNIWRASHGEPLLPLPKTAEDHLAPGQSSVVIDVILSHAGRESEDAKALAQTFRGKPLTVSEVAELADACRDVPVAKGRAVCLTIAREAANQGVTIRIDFDDRDCRAGSGGWVWCRVVVGDKLVQEGGASVRELGEPYWKGLLQQALTSDPATGFTIQLSVAS